jgi:hypothetical protein
MLPHPRPPVEGEVSAAVADDVTGVPIHVDSVLRQGGVLVFVSAGRSLAVDFSDEARAQFLRLLTDH